MSGGKRSRPESGYYRYLHSVSSIDHEAAMNSERPSPPKKHHLSLTKDEELSSDMFLVERLVSERPSKTHKVVERMVGCCISLGGVIYYTFCREE